MRFIFAPLTLLVVLLAASCDSADTIIDPPDEWTLAACFPDDDPVAVFVGRAEIGCLSDAGDTDTADATQAIIYGIMSGVQAGGE